MRVGPSNSNNARDNFFSFLFGILTEKDGSFFPCLAFALMLSHMCPVGDKDDSIQLNWPSRKVRNYLQKIGG